MEAKNYLKQTLAVFISAVLHLQVFSQSACFESLSDYSFNTGMSNMICITRGDFDNDGFQDLILGQSVGTASLKFAKGLGNGKFNATTLIATTVQQRFVIAADFNNDGNLDVVHTAFNGTGSGVHYQSGNGNGTFSATTNILPGNGSFGLTSGDYNNDGNRDILVTKLNSVILLTGNGAGGFVNAGTVVSGTSFRGIVSADFNLDGDIDLAACDATAGGVYVSYGNGTGGFSAPVFYATGAGTEYLTTADFNGDGYFDLAATNKTDGDISVIINNTAGAFFSAVDYTSGTEPHFIDNGDFNNDGIKDLAVANALEHKIAIFSGVGDGTFLTPVKINAIFAPKALVVGNFDSGTNADIVYASSTSPTVFNILLGTGSTSFIEPPSINTVGSGSQGIHYADFDEDGNMDIITANAGSNNFSLLTGLGNGYFNSPVNFSTQVSPRSVYSVDVNNDTHFDVLAANYTSGTISVYLGDGSGGFSAPSHFNCNSSPLSVKAVDLNGDGNADAVVVNETTNQVSVLMGDGAGSFGAPTAYTVGNTPKALVLARIDNNLSYDIVTANSGSNNISVLLNSGSGSFTGPTNYTTGTSPRAIDAADIDNDGDIDVFVTNFNGASTNNISILRNSGSGTFVPKVDYSSGETNANGVAAGDYNNDGNIDLMIINETGTNNTAYTSLMMGNGTGTIAFYNKFAVRQNPMGIITAEINNDGKKDIAVVNLTSNEVNILLNKTASVTPLGPTTFCAGSSVDLQSNTAPAYTWSPSGSTQTITVTSSGTYTVTNSNSFSGWCSSTSAPVTVTVNALPTISGVSGTTTICSGSNTVLTASTSAGSPTIQWYDAASGGTLLHTGATYTTPTLTANATYWVQVTDGITGCVSSPRFQVDITVSDIVPPVITGMPANITVNTDPGQCNAVVNWTNPNATDNCSLLSFVSDFANGSSFPVGTTTVTYTATDASSNVSSASFNITVNDTENPIISGMPSNINLNTAPGSCTAVATWTAPTANDNCGILSFTSSHSSGSSFPVGTTTVTYTATDVNSNVTTASFNVNVTDSENPVISGMPSNINLNTAPGLCTAVATWTAPTANDNCGILSFTSSHSSGSSFPVGTTTVTYTATDVNSNVTTASFNVVVTDNELPAFSGFPSNINQPNTTGQCGRIVTWTSPTANDNCGISSVTATHNSGDFFPVGTTSVCYTATDVNGNVHNQCFNVTVIDNEAPVISGCPSSITVCEGQTVTFSTPTATDNCSGVSITQINGLPSGSVFPVGTTLCTFRATDASGNITNCNFNVIVNSNPTVNFNLNPNSICVYNNPVALSGGSPAGGSYTASCVSGGIFTPGTGIGQCPVGNHIITYTYTNGSGCSASATQTMNVSACTGIDEEQSSLVNVYPNPNAGNFFIDIQQQNVYNVTVFDYSGKQIYSKQINQAGKFEVQLPDPSRGIYMVLISSDNFSEVKKIVVNY
jgi:hypothetical protein